MHEPLHKICHEVANALGHESVGDVFKYPLCGEEIYSDPGRFPFMAIAFAAYARAEVSKLGGGIDIDSAGTVAYWTDPEDEGGLGWIISGTYDVKDPLSEAYAVLKACARSLAT